MAGYDDPVLEVVAAFTNALAADKPKGILKHYFHDRDGAIEEWFASSAAGAFEPKAAVKKAKQIMLQGNFAEVQKRAKASGSGSGGGSGGGGGSARPGGG